MNNEVRNMITKALRDEPPVRLDYDSVLAAGRRRRARRQLSIVGGAVLGVATVVGSAVLVGQLNSNPTLTTAGPTTSATAQPAPTGGCAMPKYTGGFSDNASGQASPEELAESARLTLAFARFSLPLPEGVTVDPAAPRLCAIKISWGAQFLLRSATGNRTVFLEIKPGSDHPRGVCAPPEPKLKCTASTLADGTALLITELTPDAETPVQVEAVAWRTDNTLVRLMETGGEEGKPNSRILDDNALTKIVTASQLKAIWSGPARPVDASERRAGELTQSMSTTQVLPQGMRAEKVPQARANAMGFFVSQGGYKLNADLVDSAGSGNLFINLNAPDPGASVDCGKLPGCEAITMPDGRKATVTRQITGSVQRIALGALSPDGTQVTIMTSNMSQKAETQGRTAATRANPPLSVDDLIRIASLPWLRW